MSILRSSNVAQHAAIFLNEDYQGTLHMVQDKATRKTRDIDVKYFPSQQRTKFDLLQIKHILAFTNTSDAMKKAWDDPI